MHAGKHEMDIICIKALSSLSLNLILHWLSWITPCYQIDFKRLDLDLYNVFLPSIQSCIILFLLWNYPHFWGWIAKEKNDTYYW